MTSGRDIAAIQFCDALPPWRPTVSWLRVHSIFQRACNMQTPQGRLWVVQASDMPLAPAGMVTDCADLRPFLPSGNGYAGVMKPACTAQKRISNWAQPCRFPRG
jgi:hypothetical protein